SQFRSHAVADELTRRLPAERPQARSGRAADGQPDSIPRSRVPFLPGPSSGKAWSRGPGQRTHASISGRRLLEYGQDGAGPMARNIARDSLIRPYLRYRQGARSPVDEGIPQGRRRTYPLSSIGSIQNAG